jgi:DNA-directed RNA polymerase II subunit RPB2
MNDSRLIAEKLLKTFFTTFDYPLTHAHLNSYDQFIANDIPAIIKYSNPILLLQEKIGNTDEYTYRVEIFIGGINGDQFYIGTPTVSLKGTKEVRVLYPNEARLRNLTYASNIEADIVIKVTFTQFIENKLESSTIFLDPNEKDTKYAYLGRIPLCRLPIMLHSKYCLLRDKPNIFLQEVGESTNDYGGYFIIDGAEKVLITQQEQAFNTLYIAKQNDPAVEIYSSIQCLNPETRQVKRIAFSFMRNTNTILVSIPFVRKAIPLFVLFRALGVNADEDIIRLIFPDENDIETKILAPLLHESILDAHPFLDTYSAIQYIKVLTKGFSEAHVYDILLNQMFIHVENKPMNKALFLAECVRKILRVSAGIDTQTDRDDIRNQRCLTSGFLTRLLFLNVYKKWSKQVTLMIDKEFKFNKKIYSGNDFLNLFLPGNINTFFQVGLMTEGITRGFKGKWTVGPSEDKAGIIQPLSRLSYLDFLSHCRRVVLDFDT